MYVILAKTAASNLSGEVWMWMAILLFGTAVACFFAGVYYARMSVRWACERAKKQIHSMFNMVVDSIDQAEKNCQLLDSFSNLKLSENQLEKLQSRQTGFLESLTRLVSPKKDELEEQAAQEEAKKQQFVTQLEWTRSPEDPLTGLPNRTAFEINFLSLLESSAQSDLECGLVLVQLDKLEHLKSRFANEAIKRFIKKMSSLLCLTLRDEDLVCRCDEGRFAILIPAIDHETGFQLAEKLRQGIRQHRFRVSDNGEEVLVTASFGFTLCNGGDNTEVAFNRAYSALANSQKKGRNQLHYHDGQTTQLCAAS